MGEILKIRKRKIYKLPSSNRHPACQLQILEIKKTKWSEIVQDLLSLISRLIIKSLHIASYSMSSSK